MYIDQEQKPQVFSAGNFVGALVVHILLFATLWYLGTFDFHDDDTVIPIELMVVVNENLDGNPDEPPPEKPVEPAPPEPEPPPPAPEPTPEPPPPVTVPDAIVQEPEKPNPPKEVKPPDPPKEVKKPDPPKEDPKKARERRLQEMRASTTKVVQKPVTPPPRNNGLTDRRPEDWRKKLLEGYKPGPINQGLDASEEQRCKSLIRETFYQKWDRPPWTDQLREMVLSVQFGPGGEVRGYRLTQSSGDRSADDTVLRAAKLVSVVRGLSPSFLEKNKTVTVRFKVKPEL